jgi:hypothetical protein
MTIKESLDIENMMLKNRKERMEMENEYLSGISDPVQRAKAIVESR